MTKGNKLEQPDYGYAFSPNARLKLTEFGAKVLEAHNWGRRQRVANHIDLASLAPDMIPTPTVDSEGVVEISYWQFHDALGPFMKEGMPPVVEYEVLPVNPSDY
jgi:hypothetical protein